MQTLQAMRPDLSIEIMDLATYKLLPCNACDDCRKNGGRCTQNDESEVVLQKIHYSDIFVVASPVYFWSPSSFFKLILDKFYSRAGIQSFGSKKVGFILSGAAPVTDEEYSLVHRQMQCISSYLTWNLKMAETICTGQNPLSEQPEVLERIRQNCKALLF